MRSRFVRSAVVAAAVLAAVAGNGIAQPVSGRKTVATLFKDVTAKVADSTVRVRVDGKNVSLGTVIDSKGYILTKGDDLKQPISVRLRDGSEYDAVYVGYDVKTDLAMLKIDADVPAVTFADSAKAVVGNWVATPGLDGTALVAGVISAGVRKLYDQETYINKGNRGYLGIRFNFNYDGDGAMIDEVTPNSGAAKAKLKRNDIITRVNEVTIVKPNDLQDLMQKFKPDETLKLLVTRGEKEMEFNVKLTGNTQIDRGEMQNKMGSYLSNRRTGFPAVIMHDSVVLPADCGGPLVDLDGNILGINIARAGRVESWTLPAEVIRPLIADLKSGKLPPPK